MAVGPAPDIALTFARKGLVSASTQTNIDMTTLNAHWQVRPAELFRGSGSRIVVYRARSATSVARRVATVVVSTLFCIDNVRYSLLRSSNVQLLSWQWLLMLRLLRQLVNSCSLLR